MAFLLVFISIILLMFLELSFLDFREIRKGFLYFGFMILVFLSFFSYDLVSVLSLILMLNYFLRDAFKSKLIFYLITIFNLIILYIQFGIFLKNYLIF